MPDSDKESVHKKETSGHKKKVSDSSKSKGTSEHIEVNVVENGTIIKKHTFTTVFAKVGILID